MISDVMSDLLDRAAAARRAARALQDDPIAGRLEQYADELKKEFRRLAYGITLASGLDQSNQRRFFVAGALFAQGPQSSRSGRRLRRIPPLQIESPIL